MNNTLTGLGLALVLALVAALVGPWFINWNAYRDDFAAQAGALVGAPVKVSGAVDARLLPSPYVRFRDVTAGEGDARLTAAEIEITLAVGPLLRGEFTAQRVKIVRPRLALGVDGDGAVRTPFGAKATAGPEADRISFDRAEIVDGAIEVSAPAGRVAVTALSGVAEAGSLKGPFRFEGTGATALGRINVKLSTSRADASGALRLKLGASVEGRPETFDLDGQLAIALKPRFEGQGALARPAPKPAADASADAKGRAASNGEAPPWRVSAKIAGEPARIALDAIDASYGPDERAVRLAGKGELALGPKPRFELALGARQIDLDRAVETGDRAPAARFEAFAAPFLAATRPRIDGRVAIDIGGLVLGGDVVRGLAAELVAQNGAWRIDRASGQFPADTTISGRGALAFAGGAPGFAGAVDFASGDLGGFRAWLQGGGEAPATAVRRFAIQGAVTARVGAFTVENARITADGAASSGRLSWRAADGDAREAIEAELTAAKLDLDALGLGRLVAGALKGDGGVDAKLALDAKALTLLGVGFKGVAIDAMIDRDGVDVRKLMVDDADGAKIEGAGRIGAGEGDLAFDIDARRLTGLLAMARAAGAPEAAVAFVEARAAALAPATLSVDVHADASGRTAKARGTAAGGPFEARFAAPAFALDAEADVALDGGSPDGRRLAALAGLALSPAVSAEGGTYSLKLKGAPARGMSGEAQLSVLGLDLGARGDVGAAPGAGLSAAGDVTLKSTDATAFGEAIGRLVPGASPAVQVDLAARVALDAEQAAIENLKGSVNGRPVTGRLTAPYDLRKGFDGALGFEELPLAAVLGLALSPDAFASGGPARRSLWSSTVFGPSTLGGLTGRIAVSAARMPLGGEQLATEARFTLVARPGTASLEGVTASLAGGVLSGSLAIARPGPDATVSIRGALQGARAERLTSLRAGSPVTGALDLALDAQGTGRTLAAVVSTLAGAGSATLREGRVRGLDVGALDRIEPEVEAGLALDAPKIAAAMEKSIGASDLAIGRATTPFTLSGGVARSGAIDDGGRGPRLGGAIALDLSRLTLDADLTLSPRRDDAPQIGVSFEGPLAAPKRRIDATALTGWLSVRAVERETRRIEAMEAEIQERSRVARERMAAEEKRRAEEKKAEDERRRKEAEERARAALQPPAPATPAVPAPDLPPPLDLTPPGAAPSYDRQGLGTPLQTPQRPRGVFEPPASR